MADGQNDSLSARYPRVCVRLDRGLAEQLKEFLRAEKISASEAVQTFVREGLMFREPIDVDEEPGGA